LNSIGGKQYLTICGALGFFAACVGIGDLLTFGGTHFFSSSSFNSAGSCSPRFGQSSIGANFVRWRIKWFLLAMHPSSPGFNFAPCQRVKRGV